MSLSSSLCPCPQERCSGRRQPRPASFPRVLRGRQGRTEPHPRSQRRPPCPALSCLLSVTSQALSSLSHHLGHCVVAQSQVSQYENPLCLSKSCLNDCRSMNPHENGGLSRGGNVTCSHLDPWVQFATWSRRDTSEFQGINDLILPMALPLSPSPRPET